MTGHVVSFTPAGAPTRAVCSSCGVRQTVPFADLAGMGVLMRTAERHAYLHRGTVEFAGLPPVERAS